MIYSLSLSHLSRFVYISYTILSFFVYTRFQTNVHKLIFRRPHILILFLFKITSNKALDKHLIFCIEFLYKNIVQNIKSNKSLLKLLNCNSFFIIERIFFLFKYEVIGNFPLIVITTTGIYLITRSTKQSIQSHPFISN